MFKKEDIKLNIYILIASAYMIITYDIIQELLKNPIDNDVIPTKAFAGLISAGIGVGVIKILTSKK